MPVETATPAAPRPVGSLAGHTDPKGELEGRPKPSHIGQTEGPAQRRAVRYNSHVKLAIQLDSDWRRRRSRNPRRAGLIALKTQFITQQVAPMNQLPPPSQNDLRTSGLGRAQRRRLLSGRGSKKMASKPTSHVQLGRNPHSSHLASAGRCTL